jgi:hypothetical protein
MKLRDLTRDELYALEERLFQNVDYLTKKRTPKQLQRMVDRIDSDFVLHLEWDESWDGFDLDKPEPRDESECWIEDEEEHPHLPITHIYLAPDEHCYHWLIHELAHALQDPDSHDEHSPEWAFIYAALLKRVGHKFSALKLLENLI